MAWALLNLAMAHKQWTRFGRVTNSMLLVNAFELLYVADGLWNEARVRAARALGAHSSGGLLCVLLFLEQGAAFHHGDEPLMHASTSNSVGGFKRFHCLVSVKAQALACVVERLHAALQAIRCTLCNMASCRAVTAAVRPGSCRGVCDQHQSITVVDP
jgi:hypothetical protein